MNFTLELASVPDRAHVVLEIWHAGNHVAEIRDPGNGPLQLEIYANLAGSRWTFDLDECLEALTAARQRLNGMRDAPDTL